MKIVYPKFFFLVGCILFITCADDSDTDKVSPVIEVSLPVNNAIYELHDTVFIQASLSDNRLLRKASVHVHDLFREPGLDTVYVDQFNIGKADTVFRSYYVIDNKIDKNYSIYIDATDASENYHSELRHFYSRH